MELRDKENYVSLAMVIRQVIAPPWDLIVLWMLFASLLVMPFYGSGFDSWPVRGVIAALWLICMLGSKTRPLSKVAQVLARRPVEVGAFIVLLGVVSISLLSGRVSPNDILLAKGFGSAFAAYLAGTCYSGQSAQRKCVVAGLLVTVVGVTCAVCVATLRENPGILRRITQEQANGATTIVSTLSFYIGNWMHYTTFAFLSALGPAVLANARGVWMVTVAALSAVAAFTMFQTTLATTVIFVGVGGVFGCGVAAWHLLRKQRYAWCALLAVLLVASTVGAVKLRVGESLSAPDAVEKVKRLVENVSRQGLDGDETGRGTWLLEMSLSAFWDSPIVGKGSVDSAGEFQAGGHAHLVDVFAWYGVVGGIPLWTLIVAVGWRLMSVKMWRESAVEAGVFGCFVCFVLGGLGGGVFFPYMTYPTFFLVGMGGGEMTKWRTPNRVSPEGRIRQGRREAPRDDSPGVGSARRLWLCGGSN